MEKLGSFHSWIGDLLRAIFTVRVVRPEQADINVNPATGLRMLGSTDELGCSYGSATSYSGLGATDDLASPDAGSAFDSDRP